MSWLDDFGVLNGALTAAPRVARPRTLSAPSRSQSFSRPIVAPKFSWSDFGSGRVSNPSKPPTRQQTSYAPGERLSIALPYSSTRPPGGGDIGSTAGDLLASFGAAGTNLTANLNLANALPWFMERINVLSGEMAQSDFGPARLLGQATHPATQAFIDGVHAASEAISPVLEAFPNWVRDSQLNDRAKLYRSLVTGQKPDYGPLGPVSNPLATAGTLVGDLVSIIGGHIPTQEDYLVRDSFNPLAPLLGHTVSEQAAQAGAYQRLLEGSFSPNVRAAVGQKFSIMRDAIDLPLSVKLAIEGNPGLSDEALTKSVDAAPEGKLWSYQAGAPGIAQNLGTPLLFYLAEGRLGYGAAKGLTAFGAESQLPGISRVIAGAGRLTSVAAKIQTAAVAAGAGLTPISLTMEALARYAGNDEAIAWFDRVNRSTEFSDDPQVQLVTSFAVNPFGALGMLKRGTLSLKHGLVDVPVGVALGRRLTNFYTSEDRMLSMVARMYRLPSNEEAAGLLDRYYESRAQGYDEVLGVALDAVVDRLPKEERAAFNAMHADPTERAAAAVQAYGRLALNMIEKEPELVAARFNQHAWEYHNYPGPFNADVAALNARDYRLARDATYDLRNETNTVLGYREYLPPAGDALARAWLGDRATVPLAGPDGVQDLIRQFPALRKHWHGLVRGDQASVPREAVVALLDRAQADWSLAVKQNPVKVRTGADPILRPDSATLGRDAAEALGTSIETIDAIDAGAPDGQTLDLVHRFLADKTGLGPDELAKIPAAEAVQRASEYVVNTTRPWREAGARVVAAEKGIAAVRQRLVRLRAMPEYVRTRHDEILTAEKELAALQTLVRAASDPLVPFAESVSTAKTSGRGPIPARIRKMNPLRLSEKDVATLRRYSTEVVQDARPGTPAELHARVMGYLDATPYGEARDMHLMELASRRAEAMTRLERIGQIDEQAHAMIADHDWVSLFGRNPEGIVGWTGGLPKMTESMRRRLAIGLKNAGYPGTAKNAMLLDDGEAWRWLRDNRAEVMPQLTRRQQAVVDRTLSGPAHFDADEAAASWMRAEGGSVDDWVGTMARLWQEREAILSGTLEHNLRRTASMNLPPAYVVAAQRRAEEALTGPVFDPEWERVTHPQNLARLAVALESPDTFPLVRELAQQDDIIEYATLGLADRLGVPTVLDDPQYAAAIRNELIPEGFKPPVPGLVLPEGVLDEAIMAGDQDALAQLADDAAAAAETAPPIRTTQRAAREASTKAPRSRNSVRYRRRLSNLGVDFTETPDEAILADPANKLGVDALSVINHGITGTTPATLRGVVSLLRVIEDGDATRLGIGAPLQAEAQRVGRALLDRAALRANRSPENAGLFNKGFFPEDEQALASELEDMLVIGNPSDPLGTLQYGLKTRPKAAVVLEWSKVPGLAEELLSGHFEPYAERVGVGQLRQAFNYVFGPRSNAAIRAESRQRFIERANGQGVEPKVASRVWETWAKISHDSRDKVLRRTETAQREYVAGDNPLYADVRNIPTRMLDATVHGTRNEPGILDDLLRSGEISSADYAQLRAIDFGTLFRESTSTVRRTLKDRVPLGDALAGAYGLAVHNKAVTTAYYWFRFALDIRYHAMNYLESQILYAGRAGLRKGEIDTGLLGQTETYLRNLDSDPTNNTGYAAGRDRMALAYRTFLKEQPEALRGELRGIATEDPKLMRRAIEQLTTDDEQIADMIAAMGDRPETFLRELDAWHEKMLANVDEVDDSRVIDEALAAQMRESPELADVYGRLGVVNKELWQNVRQTFYGNAERSRAERFLNSYLLFWPLSYQIKSTKWFLRVLFDRAGGLPTNALGAYTLDQVASAHNGLLATDPEYKDWYERHKTLVFVAQMLFPVSFDSMGVSLNPALRSIFFDRTKAVWDIGPVYTFKDVLVPLGKEVYVDLYPTLKDAPGFDGVYRSLTGKKPPKVSSAP